MKPSQTPPDSEKRRAAKVTGTIVVGVMNCFGASGYLLAQCGSELFKAAERSTAGGNIDNAAFTAKCALIWTPVVLMAVLAAVNTVHQVIGRYQNHFHYGVVKWSYVLLMLLMPVWYGAFPYAVFGDDGDLFLMGIPSAFALFALLLGGTVLFTHCPPLEFADEANAPGDQPDPCYTNPSESSEMHIKE